MGVLREGPPVAVDLSPVRQDFARGVYNTPRAFGVGNRTWWMWGGERFS
ncbi:MAG: hypothetical protein HFJ80_02635 [Clostridiales bacterium]|nr:hypothetical protein [Clostridiales bacterium]